MSHQQHNHKISPFLLWLPALLFALFWASLPAARAEPPQPAGAPAKQPLAIVGGELWRASEPPLKDAVIVIAEGAISYLGTDASRAAGARVIDAKGKIVTAGLVDSLTQVGLAEISLERTAKDAELDKDDPIRAAFRAADGYNPASSVISVTRREGVTSVGVTPSGGLVTGRSAWADLAGKTPAEALVSSQLGLHFRLDDAMLGSFEHNRATALLRLRELLDDARSYRQNRGAYDRNQLRRLGSSRLDYEAVLPALDGQLPVVAHVDRAVDILNVLQLAAEHGLRLVLASAAEAWQVAPAIAQAQVPVILYPLDHGPRSFTARGAREDNAARLHQAGVTVVLATGESHNSRKLRQEVGNAIRAGLPRPAALDAVTAAPARIFGLADRYGALKIGRIGNLVVWSGDPFELSTKVEAVIIRGEPVSLRSRQTALLERYR